ncbi:hypothetical protein [Streptacidiphilus rugosus]|uniref:hypothetical protein n=1 Tax=Streptacidiphilus rugosus TaxID=405783 RepID=UPI0038CD4C4B
MLRQRFGSSALVRGPLEHLLDLQRLPAVAFGVVPFSAERPALWCPESPGDDVGLRRRGYRVLDPGDLRGGHAIRAARSRTVRPVLDLSSCRRAATRSRAC